MNKKRREIFIFRPFVFVKHEVHSLEKPRPRSGHRVVCDQKNLYSYGGFNPSVNSRVGDSSSSNDQTWSVNRPLFKEIWKFNFAKESWKRLPLHKNMPDELASNAVVLKGDLMVIHGGTGVPFGDNCNNRIYIYNVTTEEMYKIPDTGNRPEPQYGQAVISDGPYLYTVGGTSGYEYTCDIHRFNMRTHTWESVYICSGKDQFEPRGRYRHELGFDGRTIYVLGGGTAAEVYGFTEIPAFDTHLNKWSTVYTHCDPINNLIPAARRCHGLVNYIEEDTGTPVVVISGGYNGGQMFDDVWKLDLISKQWTCLRLSLMPVPLYFHSTAITPSGRMYSFGGITKEGNEINRVDAVYSIWLKIPKLSEISWEALNYFYPNLKNKSRSELLNIGVPLSFVERLD